MTTRAVAPSVPKAHPHEIAPADAARLVRRTRQIGGWLSPGAIYLFTLIDSIQKRHAVTGNLFEIGVHHGKSAVILGAMSRPNDKLGVCDIFDSQALNVSASGRGDQEVFLANFRDAFPDHDFLTVYKKLSTSLTPGDLTSCRFLHIDGGHSTAEARADLELCLQCLAPGGTIAVDDAFNPAWPGVTEAILSFLADHPGIKPLVLGFNKMLLVEADQREVYDRTLRDAAQYRRDIPREPYSVRVVEVSGCPTYVFYVHSSRSERSLSARLRRLEMEHPA